MEAGQTKQMEEWECVQITYPTGYDYSTFSDYTLLQLARHHADEPNTATLAMGELRSRKNGEVEEIAKSMLDDIHSDKYLLASALNDLASINFQESFKYLQKWGLSEEEYLVKEVINIIAYLDDVQINERIISFAASLKNKVMSNAEFYLADDDFVEFSYHELLKRYHLL